MPFDGNGVFNRIYNWVADRDASVKIRADRTDAEMDGMAAGLSNCVTKDGQTTATQRVPFAQGISVGDGTVSAPAINFASDTDTGIYRVSSNALGIAAGGVKIAQIDADGFSALKNQTLPDAYQAWYNVNKKLADDNADINILVGIDSTGDSANELPDKIAQLVFADNPTFTVKIYYYDFDLSSWGSPTTRQVGTGSNTVNIYNAARAGATADLLTGLNQDGIGNSYDLIILSYGHNYNTWTSLGITGFSGTDTVYRIDESIEDLTRIHADVPILVVLQDPSQALLNTNQDERAHRAWGQIAEWRGGISLADGRRIFIDAAKPGSWYADDIHPTATGHIALANEVLRTKRTSKGRFVNPPRVRQVCNRIGYFRNKNLLLNGLFDTFTGGTPDSWTKSGAGTSAQETTDIPSAQSIPFTFSSNSVKLTDDVHLTQAVSDAVLDTIRGKSVVFACLLKVTGGDENKDAGNMKIFGGVGGEAYNGNIATPGSKACWLRHGYPYANGAYAWKFCEEKIPYDASSGTVIVQLYGTDGTTGDGKYALFNAAGLFLREDFDRFQPWF